MCSTRSSTTRVRRRDPQCDHPLSDLRFDQLPSVTRTASRAPKRERELTEWLASPVYRSACSRCLSPQLETVLAVDPPNEVDRTLTPRHRGEHRITRVAGDLTEP